MNALISQRAYINSHGVACDCLESEYTKYFNGLGLFLRVVSNYSHPDTWSNNELFNNIDLIILTGGGDIDPSYKRGNPELQSREMIEERLIDYAIVQNIPVLGICRGMQFINIYFYGEISCLGNENEPHPVTANHEVKIINPDIKNIINSESMFVNSYHDYGVLKRNISPELEIIAESASGGIVESLRHPDIKISGIQFHPERENNDQGIVDSLVNELIKRD